MTNSLSVSPDEISEWTCPYCNQTRQTLDDLREHITESTEEDHRGIDGLKPTRDLIAYGPNGQEVDRVEGVSTEPAEAIDEYDKREVIINAWIAASRDPDRKAVQAISGASTQYVSKLLNELESGEIPRETWIKVLNYGLRDELKERLKDYNPNKNPPMSAQATTKDLIDESTKKDRILAAYRANPNADKNAVADALDVSYEYVRQIYKDIDDRNPTEMQKLQEGEPHKELDEELEGAVEQRLREAGALDGTSEKQDGEAVSHDQMSPAQVEGMVPASEIADVRDKIELLLEQAEYTGDEDAEFVARKGLQWLDDLLEQAE